MNADASASALGKALMLQRLIAGQTIGAVGAGRLRTAERAPAAASPSRRPNDQVDISPEGRALLAASEDPTAKKEAAATEGEAPAGGREPAGPKSALSLSAEERTQVRELQARDIEVRTHENSHAAAGGAFAGAPSLQFQQGPDGRQYAVGGEVPIRIESGGTPEETIRNAAQVRAAALAPSNPSSADLAIAAAATSMETKARSELSRERQEEVRAATGPEDTGAPEAAGPVIDLPRLIDLFA